MTFYGQCGEDKHVYEKYFKNKRNGVFLELGALDGITYSNTKFFEESLGWTGVLIEPVPDYCHKIKSHRTQSKVYNNIVSTRPEPMDIYVHGAVSSVKEFTTQQYYDGWHKGKDIQVIQVPSRRLDDILHDAGITHIDFWSLDVEGAEYEVLQTMDWNITVGVICMEVCGGESAEMNEKCREILRSHGFVYDGLAAHNEIWVHPLYRPKRILCCDIRLAGKPHHDWKEGYELMYAFRNLGHMCDIAGPNGYPYTERDIVAIANKYDLIVVTENYPEGVWKWWNWASIRTPKLYWAIDTHVRTFPWLSAFDHVAYNIQEHVKQPNGFWMPYALSTVHQKIDTVYPKVYDTVFIGNLNVSPRRKELCDRFGIRHMEAYGTDYIKTMKQAKICFNSSISNDINAKYFEIMGSGTFLLTNYNQSLVDLFENSPDLLACMYKTDEEIGEKIRYYLEHEEEREAIAKRLYNNVWTHHTWENRAIQILTYHGVSSEK